MAANTCVALGDGGVPSSLPSDKLASDAIACELVLLPPTNPMSTSVDHRHAKAGSRSFLDLPAEVRVKIYRAVVTDSVDRYLNDPGNNYFCTTCWSQERRFCTHCIEPLTMICHDLLHKLCTSPLFRLCHQVRREAIHVGLAIVQEMLQEEARDVTPYGAHVMFTQLKESAKSLKVADLGEFNSPVSMCLAEWRPPAARSELFMMVLR